MKLLSRISLIIGFVALQLTSLSGGPGCPIPTGGGAANGANAGMAAMAGMPGMIATDTALSGSHPPAAHATQTDGSDKPTPQAPCTTMSVCTFASAPAVIEAPVDALQEVADVILPQFAMAPAAILLAPETPPPRV